MLAAIGAWIVPGCVLRPFGGVGEYIVQRVARPIRSIEDLTDIERATFFQDRFNIYITSYGLATTKVFHRRGCRYLDRTREPLIFSPCEHCHGLVDVMNRALV